MVELFSENKPLEILEDFMVESEASRIAGLACVEDVRRKNLSVPKCFRWQAPEPTFVVVK